MTESTRDDLETVRAEERESCAKIADAELQKQLAYGHDEAAMFAAKNIATAIRNRPTSAEARLAQLEQEKAAHLSGLQDNARTITHEILSYVFSIVVRPPTLSLKQAQHVEAIIETALRRCSVLNGV